MTPCRSLLVRVLASGVVACLLPSCDVSDRADTESRQRPIIYGADERYDHYELTDPVLLMAAGADVVLLDTSQVTPAGGGYDIDLYSYGTFGQYYDLCPSEPFEAQPAPGFCSGFKVGDDLIVTAGHCVDPPSCPSTVFVFGFVMQDAVTPVGHVGADDVYFCTDIVDRVETATDDWAVVRVDRNIVGHPSLPVRRSSAVETDPDVFGLFVVGHPGGIPLKFVGGSGPAGDTGLRGASVRNTAVNYFESDLDVYAGNSGSAVFSLNQQGEFLFVEGILVRGNPDWTWTGTCNVSNVCSETTGCGGYWEQFTRSTNFHSVIPPLPPPCGDATCEAGEDCLSCPADCGPNSPGPVYVNEDFSAGLGNWTVSAGWTTGAIHSMTDYPAAGSGAPVASIASCIVCDMELAGSYDLTPYCAVRLSFWRFVDNRLDNTDYLSLFFWNGSGWDNIETWSNGSGDSNRWEYEEYALDGAYLIPDFTFRFQVRTNQANEIVQIDDVRLLAYQSAPCLSDADCDDGQFCNGAETCDGSQQCQPGTPPALDDGVGCTVDSCDEANDVVTHTPDNSACDDGQFCNGAETCHPVQDCQAGVPPVVDDGVGCTVDSCDEANDVVTHTPDHGACDDGQFCNGAETCHPTQDCQAGVPPVVDDGVGCTVDSCDEANDVVTHTPDHSACDDGQFCNGAETCHPVQDCRAGVPPAVDDGVGCTVDGCDEANEVVTHTPDDDLCDDDNSCTNDACGAEGCIHTPLADGDSCPSGICRDGVCEPNDGAGLTPRGCGCRLSTDAGPPLGSLFLFLLVTAFAFLRRRVVTKSGRRRPTNWLS